MSNEVFSMTPTVSIKRSTFDMSSTVKTAFNAGKLIPLGEPIEVLPGDTFSLKVNSFVRMTPTINVPMSGIVCDIWSFFVPNRIVWTHWKEFCGENNTDPWTSATVYKIPKIRIGSQTAAGPTIPVESILSYMGISAVNIKLTNDPTGSTFIYDSWLNALPVRGYCSIWNNFFRDENIEYPVLFNTGDSDTSFSTTDTNHSGSATGNHLLPVNRFHDYFSTALPQAQFGDPVHIPAGTNPIKVNSKGSTIGGPYTVYTSGSSPYAINTGASGITGTAYLDPSSLGTLDELRIAEFTQHYLWKLGTFGHRYVEVIKGFFGVNAPDYLLDMPLLLGHHRFNININPVVQTSATETVPIDDDTYTSYKGDISGYSATRSDSGLFVHSFVEHGFIINLLAVRTERSYSQVVSKLWRYENFLDLYNPIFAMIGSQPVYTYEIAGGLALSGLSSYIDKRTVFGYQEAWSQYKYRNNLITGIMRDNSFLSAWTTADKYNTVPILSASWLNEGYDNLNRTLSVPGNSNTPQFLGDFWLQLTATRPMPLHSIPGFKPYF